MTKLNKYFLLLLLSFLTSGYALGTTPGKTVKAATKILRNNTEKLDSVNQLLVIYNETPESNSATLVAFEKKNKKWITVFRPMEVGIGRNGFAAPGEKREGDSKSPTGLFRLGQLYGYEETVDSRMPYRQSTLDDKWIDDPDSPDYNKPIKGNTTAKSFENLKISSNEYKLCLVIEYNMHPIVKGMGSAIFMHLSYGDAPNPSSGCVVLTPNNLSLLLKWMNPGSKPSVLMGTFEVLNSKQK